jgi:hypothetical protein
MIIWCRPLIDGQITFCCLKAWSQGKIISRTYWSQSLDLHHVFNNPKLKKCTIFKNFLVVSVTATTCVAHIAHDASMVCDLFGLAHIGNHLERCRHCSDRHFKWDIKHGLWLLNSIKSLEQPVLRTPSLYALPKNAILFCMRTIKFQLNYVLCFPCKHKRMQEQK